MHADMVGYSRLIGQDDAGTFMRLRNLRRGVIDPALAANHGTLRQTAGDSLLVVFDSIDNAIEAALEIQLGVARAEPDSVADRIRFRIGINLGDAILDESDMHGDGVNVTVRLQSICPTGRICVSRAIRDHARQRAGIRFEPLGPLALKNIAKPVEAFVLEIGGAPASSAARLWRRIAVCVPSWRIKKTTAALVATIPMAGILITLAMAYRVMGVPNAQHEESLRAEARHAEELRELGALTAAQRAIANAMSREKGVPLPVLVQILARFGQTTTDGSFGAADVQTRLERKADEFIALRQQLARLTGDEPRIATLRADADAALGRADFSLARDKLKAAADIEIAAGRALAAQAKERALAAAELMARSARVAAVSLRYRDAASDLADAAKFAEPFDRDQQWRFLVRSAFMLVLQGGEFNDNAALQEAIARYTEALALVPRATNPFDWARTQHYIATAERSLGERERDTVRLESSAARLRLTLEERRRELVPRDWADSQEGLGLTLWRLGERERGTATLENAAQAFRLALEERLRGRSAFNVAVTQRNLARVLADIGARESGTAHLEEALGLQQGVLNVISRDRAPLDWAQVRNSHGVTLMQVGERTGNTIQVAEAIAEVRSAEQVWTHDRYPLGWALAESNIGSAFEWFGERDNDLARLEGALASYRAALEVWTRASNPLDWSSAEYHSGVLLEQLGEHDSGTARLEDAVAAYRAVLAEWTPTRAPGVWARTQCALGRTLQTIGLRTAGSTHLAESAAALTACLDIEQTDRPPSDVQATRDRLAAVQAEVARRSAAAR